MHRTIDEDLSKLKAKIGEMGTLVEDSLMAVMRAVQDQDMVALAAVDSLEERINELQMQTDHDCLQVLAKQSPLATDLRTILAIVRATADLERMGDQAVNISHCAKELLKKDSELRAPTDFTRMAASTRRMVRDAMQAFERMNSDRAREVLQQDDEIDGFKRRITNELMDAMEKEPTKIRMMFQWVLIARNLERIADHATNLAEEVIFATSGCDVRHGHLDEFKS